MWTVSEGLCSQSLPATFVGHLNVQLPFKIKISPKEFYSSSLERGLCSQEPWRIFHRIWVQFLVHGGSLSVTIVPGDLAWCTLQAGHSVICNLVIEIAFEVIWISWESNLLVLRWFKQVSEKKFFSMMKEPTNSVQMKVVGEEQELCDFLTGIWHFFYVIYSSNTLILLT